MRHVPVDREAPAAAYLQARRLLREGEVGLRLPRGRDLRGVRRAGADARCGRAGPRDRGAAGAGDACGAASGCGRRSGRSTRRSRARRRAGADWSTCGSARRCTSPPDADLVETTRGSGTRAPGRARGAAAAARAPAAAGGVGALAPRPPRRRRARPRGVVRARRDAAARRSPPTWGPGAAYVGWGRWRQRPRVQRVAAYAVIVRDGQILLSRLAAAGHRAASCGPCPAAALDHGEDPRDAVVREVHEETGLDVTVGDDRADLLRCTCPTPGAAAGASTPTRCASSTTAGCRRTRPSRGSLEVDGSTAEAAWQPLADVLDGTRADRRAGPRGAGRPPAAPPAAGRGVRPGARAGRSRRCCSPGSPPRGSTPGSGRLPGGGVDHGEDPRDAVRARGREETGLTCDVGEVLDVDAVPLRRHRARRARDEDFHGVGLVFAGHGRRRGDVEPRVVEVGRHHRRGRLGAAGRRRRPAPGAAWSRLAWPPLAARPRRGLGRGRERDHLHLRRPVAEVRRRRRRRGRPRPRRLRRAAGAAGDRPRRRRHRPPRAARRADRGRAASRSSSSTAPGSSPPTSRWPRPSPSRATPGPSTPSSPSAAARASTPPRRSTCCSPTPAS